MYYFIVISLEVCGRCCFVHLGSIGLCLIGHWIFILLEGMIWLALEYRYWECHPLWCGLLGEKEMLIHLKRKRGQFWTWKCSFCTGKKEWIDPSGGNEKRKRKTKNHISRSIKKGHVNQGSNRDYGFRYNRMEEKNTCNWP